MLMRLLNERQGFHVIVCYFMINRLFLSAHGTLISIAVILTFRLMEIKSLAPADELGQTAGHLEIIINECELEVPSFRFA